MRCAESCNRNRRNRGDRLGLPRLRQQQHQAKDPQRQLDRPFDAGRRDTGPSQTGPQGHGRQERRRTGPKPRRQDETGPQAHSGHCRQVIGPHQRVQQPGDKAGCAAMAAMGQGRCGTAEKGKGKGQSFPGVSRAGRGAAGQQLAAGFPTGIARMADQIDRTEPVGDAVLVQTHDGLDSVQPLRALAQLKGDLETDAAQVVEVSDRAISIAPASPEVIYVPSYQPSVVYTSVAPPTAHYVSDDDDGQDALTAGAIVFGSPILIE